MNKRVLVVAGVAIAIGTVLCLHEDGAHSREVGAPAVQTATDPKESAPHLQSPEEALAQDLALIAASRGWTLEQAKADHEAAEVVGRIAEQVAAETPDIFVGSVLSPEPGGAPALYIKGPADEFVRSLVANAGIEVKVVDNQPYSFDELNQRRREVHHALQEEGFANLSTQVDITKGGLVDAAVTREPGLTDDTSKILASVPIRLRDSVALRLSNEPVAVPQDIRGGMQMTYYGNNWCTSGWSVYAIASGQTGMSTAGHCPVNGIVEVGILPVTLVSEHRGFWGDVEWHTSTAIETAKFYATSTDVRNVTELEAWSNISQGESICLYGRRSDSRSCWAVQNLLCSATWQGYTLEHLVRMNGQAGMDGDSGGGWSNVNKAYGVHYGRCNGNDAFTVADLIDDALSVRVRLSHTAPTGIALYAGDSLDSADGRFTAIMQTDGNFVVYKNGVGPIWASSWCGQTSFGPGFRAVMQFAGNFVIYTPGNVAVWATTYPQTQPSCPSDQQTTLGSNFFLVMQSDGNLIMSNQSGGVLWHTHTGGQ